MESKYPDKVLAFDSLFTTNHIQMLKVLLTSVPSSVQKQLAVYIKLLELRYTLTFFQKYPFASLPYCTESFKITDVFDDIFPLCNSMEREKLQNFKNLMQNLENMQEILQFMEMMREISPELFSPAPRAADGEGSNTANAANLSDLLGLLSGFDGMDLSQMSEMLQNM